MDLNFKLLKFRLVGPNQCDAEKHKEKGGALLEMGWWFRF